MTIRLTIEAQRKWNNTFEVMRKNVYYHEAYAWLNYN